MDGKMDPVAAFLKSPDSTPYREMLRAMWRSRAPQGLLLVGEAEDRCHYRWTKEAFDDLQKIFKEAKRRNGGVVDGAVVDEALVKEFYSPESRLDSISSSAATSSITGSRPLPPLPQHREDETTTKQTKLQSTTKQRRRRRK